MKKILCPTDFSGTAENAIAYAAKLAQTTNSELTLLNVQPIYDLAQTGMITGQVSGLQEVAGQLEAKSEEVSRTFKISCHAEVETSYAQLSSVIHQKASQFDLVVMGSNGPDDLYQFFVGSNTYNAMVKTETPTLLVPAGYRYKEIRNIVYAFDYLRERKLPLNRLATLIADLKCALTVLQVMEEAYSEDAENDLKELQFIIQTYYSDPKINYDTIRSSEVAKSINSYILRSQPDMLALCSVHRNFIQRVFHKSIIKHITAICDYPVFVFHS